ncbi:hypothetical protein ACSDR0_03815 [Streptosporangium sp. G11]|uniref:hypothetical protein n=1 Tax=Streptosporangium sp. G11 TaxID=3436926 RepID=UPI003EBD9183
MVVNYCPPERADAEEVVREIGHRGITVNSVLPGAVLTQALINAGQQVIDAEVTQTLLASRP